MARDKSFSGTLLESDKRQTNYHTNRAKLANSTSADLVVLRPLPLFTTAPQLIHGCIAYLADGCSQCQYQTLWVILYSADTTAMTRENLEDYHASNFTGYTHVQSFTE